MTSARIIRAFPAGLSYARNAGLAQARGELVGFVDDDEVVDEKWVDGVLSAFETHEDAAGVLGAVCPLDDDGIPYCTVLGESPRRFSRRTTPPWVIGTGGNMVFRRRDLTALGGFDVRLGAGSPGRSGEETDVFVRLLKRGRVLVWTPDAVVYHPTKTPAEHLASRAPYGHGTGAVVRRRRALMIGVKYAVALSQSYLAGIRGHDRQRRREAVRTAAGFLAGLLGLERSRSPRIATELVPPQVRATVGHAALQPLGATYAPHPRFRYRAGASIVQVLPGPGDNSSPGAVHDGTAAWVVEASS